MNIFIFSKIDYYVSVSLVPVQSYNRVRVIVLNATFNNISVILWRSVLLMEETGVPWENHWPAASHLQILSHNVVSSTPRLSGIRTHNFSANRHWVHWYMYWCSCKCNYHTIMTMTTSKSYNMMSTFVIYNVVCIANMSV
jgi:hypothetical protein